MQNILIETLPGRIAYQDLKNASLEDFTYNFVGGVGVIHVSRQFIKYDDIFWGETEENPARAKGSSKKNIKGLADSRRKGIDPTAKLPAVQETVITDIEGKTYHYKAENGITRKKSDYLNGYTEGAWFDVVRYVETEGRSAEYNRRVWLHIENDPLPSEGNSVDDLVQSCSEMICSGDLPKEESSIRDFVYESAPNMPTQDKNEVVRIVLKEEDVPTRTISWRDNECREWLDEKCLDEVKVDYCFPFHYFQDRVYSVLKQYHNTKEVQYVVQHFDNKGDSDEVIKAARITQKEKWEEFREVMKSVALYMVANDWQLPVDKDQYFPQIKTGDNKEDTNRIVFD
jgi:hypothetical protein